MVAAVVGQVSARLIIGDRSWLWLAAVLIVIVALTVHPVAAGAVSAVVLSTLIWSQPLAPLDAGQIRTEGVLASDEVAGRYGPWAVIQLGNGPVLANLPNEVMVTRGDRVLIGGKASGEPGVIREWRYRGVVDADEVQVLSHSGSWFLSAGEAVRKRVRARLQPLEGGRALVAGFLVGDTSGVEPLDQDAMKRAGISHFTAVSGSNVALFLTLLFVMAGPLGIGPNLRPVIALLGLPVFAAATGFEPSVMRAAVMAAVVFGSRLLGLALEAWQVLAAAVIVLLVWTPGLASNAGFELSAAATAGVIAGARWPLSTKLARPLAVTAGAQVAVAPILLAYFGRVPLLSPLINLIAAPVVSVATLLGAVGVIAFGPLLDIASFCASLVLWLARTTSVWPQIGWTGLGVVGLISLAWWRLPLARGVVAIGAAVMAVMLLVVPADRPPDAGAVVFDVGQGDSILLSGGGGRFALVDGGSDPVMLIEKLHRYGVTHLDLMVPTHGDADHAMGLTGLPGRIPIALVWFAMDPHETQASRLLIGELTEESVAVETPFVGETFDLGSLHIVVDGPLRRYAAPNDQSIVLTVVGPTRSMLLTGDIGSIAQRELDGLTADVLKVPHHGSATSDAQWLESVGASLSVISVGPNDYGHPADWVIELLEASGGHVVRTDQIGDVAVPLGGGGG
jgi:competence protein ComEC